MRSTKDVLFALEMSLGSKLSTIRLTNSSKIIHFNSYNYLPHSGLDIEEMILTPFEHEVTIQGIFQKHGIESLEMLGKGKISINVIENRKDRKVYKNVIQFFPQDTKIEGNSFTIKCVSRMAKMDTALSKIYRRVCRADLGDAACRVNLDHFQDYYSNNSKGDLIDYNDGLVGPKSAPAGYLAKYKFMNISGQEILINNVLRDLIFIKIVTRILRNVQISFMNKLIKILSF